MPAAPLENEICPALASDPESASLDARFMALALEEAESAARADEVPIGVVVVGPGPDLPVLARAHNRTRGACDPTAHAEMLAIRIAARATGYQRLEGCTLYSTVEPCFMCAGALVHARIARVVFGVPDPKFGGTVSLGNVLDTPGLNHRVTYDQGVGAERARELLQSFFREKRR